jgi:hypothetical protein
MLNLRLSAYETITGRGARASLWRWPACFLSRRAGWTGSSLARLDFLAAVFCLFALSASSATLSVGLDRDTITLGESVNLSLTISGAPQNATQGTPGLPALTNLQVSYIGPSSQISIVNGQFSSTVTHNFSVTPRQPGDYTIPAFAYKVGAEMLTSQPVLLKVLKPGAPSEDAINSGSQLAFLKLSLPKKQLYLGEAVAAELQLYVRSGVQNISRFQIAPLAADGLTFGSLNESPHRQAQIGSTLYSVIPLPFSVRALKTGSFSIGPLTASVVLDLPSNNRRRDPFFDPFNMLGGGEQKQVALATSVESIEVLPLPATKVPSGFSGAVGTFTIAVSAGPTNLTVGDPLTVRVQISGRGALDSLTLPEQAAWRDFKAYPQTSRVETTDPLGLQGVKIFEQLLAPQTSELKELPAVVFSYFDPEKKQYQTLNSPPVPMTVRPGATSASGPVLAAARNTQDSTPWTPDIVPNKQRLGTIARIGPPLLEQRWFLGLQAVPLLAWVLAAGWRRRADLLANNPRLRRQRKVAKLVRDELARLHDLAAKNQPEEFFSTVFRLLQEQLGERLDLPASAITEAVIEEKLRPRGVEESALSSLQELFQVCNMARYAPVRGSQELNAVVQKLEAMLGTLQKLSL